MYRIVYKICMEERLKLFLAMEGLSPSQFADKIGVQRSGVSHLLSGRNKPSFEFINKMMAAFPKVNPDWLIMGTGKAYRDFPAPSGSQSEPQPQTDAYQEDSWQPAGDQAGLWQEAYTPTPQQPAEATLEESAETTNEPDLFNIHPQLQIAPQQPQTAPVQAPVQPVQSVSPASQPAAQPSATPAPKPVAPAPQMAAPQPVVAPQPPKYPAENRVKAQPAVAGGKRIAQITILFSDGTYEVR